MVRTEKEIQTYAGVLSSEDSQAIKNSSLRTFKTQSMLAKLKEMYAKYKIWVNGAIVVIVGYAIYKLATRNRR